MNYHVRASGVPNTPDTVNANRVCTPPSASLVFLTAFSGETYEHLPCIRLWYSTSTSPFASNCSNCFAYSCSSFVPTTSTTSQEEILPSHKIGDLKYKNTTDSRND